MVNQKINFRLKFFFLTNVPLSDLLAYSGKRRGIVELIPCEVKEICCLIWFFLSPILGLMLSGNFRKLFAALKSKLRDNFFVSPFTVFAPYLRYSTRDFREDKAPVGQPTTKWLYDGKIFCGRISQFDRQWNKGHHPWQEAWWRDLFKKRYILVLRTKQC